MTARRVLFVVSNPATNTPTGWTIGFWLSELAHPYADFVAAGWEPVIASPEGGAVTHDAMSDPESPNARGVDLISTGFKHHPVTVGLLASTQRLSDIDDADIDAILVVGGLAPMLTFPDNDALQQYFARCYEAGKPAATICHGSVILLSTRLSSGALLAEGKRWTGFSDGEEDVVDNMAGTKVQPFRIEETARSRGLAYECVQPFAPHAVRDGNLVSGQQGSSGHVTARHMLDIAEGR